jgi:pimeloyl-ACP methyl ester carboxylesterase
MDLPGLAILLLTGLIAGVAILTAYTAYMLTHPPRRGYAFAIAKSLPADPSELRFVDANADDRIGAPFESWTFRSRGLDLPVWEITGCNPDGPTVILTHGWSDSRVVSLCRAPAILRHARRLILWDLPGHGEAPGRCSMGVLEPDDLAALVDALRDPGSLILYGHSLGAGVSIEAGPRLGPRIAGVIAEAPYRVPITPARNVMRLARLPYRVNLPLALLIVRPRFDRADAARALKVPLLVIHGDADQVCPLQDAREIAAACPSGKLENVPQAGHVDLFTDPRFAAQIEPALAAFFRTVHLVPSA